MKFSSPISVQSNSGTSALTENLISVYRGWHAFESEHGGPSIVDFDLAGAGGKVDFSTRTDVLNALRKLHDSCQANGPASDFLQARVGGSIYYLRALMGEQIPFDEYVTNTLGVAPEPFPDEEIQAAREIVERQLAVQGLSLCPEDRQRYEAGTALLTPEEVREGIVGNQEFWLAQVRQCGIPVPEKLQLKVEFAEVDAYWSNWISGTLDDGITLVINLHRRQKYRPGSPLILSLHEICGHAVHMSIWRQAIADGRLNPACGVTTVHGPETVLAEGLAQTVPNLLDAESQSPPEFALTRAMQYYRLIVLHNAHLMIHRGDPVERVLDYAAEMLPFSERANLESEVRDRGRDPLFKTYQLSYAVGERLIRQISQGLNREQLKRFFLEMYTEPMTPDQLVKFGREVAHL